MKRLTPRRPDLLDHLGVLSREPWSGLAAVATFAAVVAIGVLRLAQTAPIGP